MKQSRFRLPRHLVHNAEFLREKFSPQKLFLLLTYSVIMCYISHNVIWKARFSYGYIISCLSIPGALNSGKKGGERAKISR